MSSPAIAIVRVRAAPGRAAMLEKHLGALRDQLRRQPGCQSCELWPLAVDHWQVQSHWISQSELDAHLSGPEAQQWLGHLGCGSLALGLEFESLSAD